MSLLADKKQSLLIKFSREFIRKVLLIFQKAVLIIAKVAPIFPTEPPNFRLRVWDKA